MRAIQKCQPALICSLGVAISQDVCSYFEHPCVVFLHKRHISPNLKSLGYFKGEREIVSIPVDD
ncbi:MAG: hypothetical protein QOK37_3547 [Thermoanaerobaculia bacterium]|nr:hypothetical protein [Thermoanaerobaculia bacterium]